MKKENHFILCQIFIPIFHFKILLYKILPNLRFIFWKGDLIIIIILFDYKSFLLKFVDIFIYSHYI